MKKKRVNILGTEYKIKQVDGKPDFDGRCFFYKKTIEIRKVENMLDDDASAEEKRDRYDIVLRHELMHAFIYESGLEENAYNEEYVQFLAIQTPKMMEMFKSIGCI